MPKFKLCNEDLTEVLETKYLGHYITADGKDSYDMSKACVKLYALGNTLLRKFHMCTEKVKIKLFMTYCSQFYCAQLWKYNISDNTYKKISVAYNNVFRFFLGLSRDNLGRPCSASGMFVNRKVKSFQELMRNQIYNFKCRLAVSTNELVICANSPSITVKSKMRKHWARLLFSNNT